MVSLLAASMVEDSGIPETIRDYIEYFIYELDFGSKWVRGCITYDDGQDIPPRTADDLYNFIKEIVKNYEV